MALRMQYILAIFFIYQVTCAPSGDNEFYNPNERIEDLAEINNHQHNLDDGIKEKRCHDLNLDWGNHILGAAKNPLPAVQVARRDILKKQCENCLESCKLRNTCDLCKLYCKDQTIPAKPKDIVSRMNPDDEEFGLTEDQDRYYTVGSIGPGPKQELLARLLDLPKHAKLERLIVLAKNKSKLKQNSIPHPVVIDTAHVFTANDGKPSTLDVELHDVNTRDPDLDHLTAKLNKELDAAIDAKKKLRGDSHLTPNEIDRVIEHAVKTPNKNQHASPNIRSGGDDINDDDAQSSIKKKKHKKKFRQSEQQGDDNNEDALGDDQELEASKHKNVEKKGRFSEVDDIDFATPESTNTRSNEVQSFPANGGYNKGHSSGEYKAQYGANQGGYGEDEDVNEEEMPVYQPIPGDGGYSNMEPNGYKGGAPPPYQQGDYQNQIPEAKPNYQPSQDGYQSSGPEQGYLQPEPGYEQSESDYQQPQGTNGYNPEPAQTNYQSYPSQAAYEEPHNEYYEPQPEPEPASDGYQPENAYPTKSQNAQYQSEEPKSYSQQANAYKQEDAYKPPATYENGNSGYRVKEKMNSTPYGATGYRTNDENLRARPPPTQPMYSQPPAPKYSGAAHAPAYSVPAAAPAYSQPAPTYSKSPTYSSPPAAPATYSAPPATYSAPPATYSAPPAPPPVPPPAPPKYPEDISLSSIELDDTLPDYAPNFGNYALGAAKNSTPEIPNDPKEKAQFYEDKYKKLKSWLRSNIKEDPEEESENPIVTEFTKIIKNDLADADMLNKTDNKALDAEIKELISESLDSKNATQLADELGKIEEKLAERKNSLLGLENLEQFKNRFQNPGGKGLLKLKQKLADLPRKDSVLGDKWKPADAVNKIGDSIAKLHKPLAEPNPLDIKNIVHELKSVPGYLADKAEKVADVIQAGKNKLKALHQELDNLNAPQLGQRHKEDDDKKDAMVGDTTTDGKNETVACDLDELLDKFVKSEEMYLQPYYPNGYRDSKKQNLLDKLIHPYKGKKADGNGKNADDTKPGAIPTLPELIKDLENIKLPTMAPIGRNKIPNEFPQKHNPKYQHLFRDTPRKTLQNLPELQVNDEKLDDTTNAPKKHGPKFPHLFKDSTHLTPPPPPKYQNPFRQAPEKPLPTLPTLHEDAEPQNDMPDAHIPFEFPETQHPKFQNQFRPPPQQFEPNPPPNQQQRGMQDPNQFPQQFQQNPFRNQERAMEGFPQQPPPQFQQFDPSLASTHAHHHTKHPVVGATKSDLDALEKLLPVDDEHNKIIEDGAHQMYFVGDGVKLPLKVSKKEDGSMHLSVDLEKLCQCNKTLCYNSTTLMETNPQEESDEPLGLEIPDFDKLRAQMEQEENRANERTSDLYKRSPNDVNIHNYKNDITKYYEDENKIQNMLNEAGDEQMDEDVQKRVGLLTNVLSWMKDIAVDEAKQNNKQ